VLFDGVGVPFIAGFFAVACVSLFESPVVREPGGTGVLTEVGSLYIVWVEFVLVGSFDQHLSLATLKRVGFLFYRFFSILL
jgi:hypothetical protein